jgi:glycopeptide antibiotics resistance protein
MLNQLLRPAILIFGLTIPLWVIFRITVSSYKKKRQQEFSQKQEIILFLFYVYIVCALLITTVPIPMTRSESLTTSRINLIPLINTTKGFAETLSSEKHFMTSHLLENIFGNVMLFIPMGIFLPLVSSKFRSIKKVILFAASCSGAIELIQLISRQFGIYRSVDIDDIILNTLGAALGFLFFQFLLKHSITTKQKSA